VLFVLLERTGENEYVVQVDEAEVESSQNVVHEALRCLGGVAQAEGHEGELEKAEWSGDDCLLYIVRMNGDLVLRSHQVDLGTSEKLVELIVDMTDGVVVWECPGVECSVVAVRAPTIAFIGYDV
jgi:hypothetical protein